MLPILFTTNIDVYKGDLFPAISVIPRKGEYIQLKELYLLKFRNAHLPIRLEVTSITYTDKATVVELWYNDLDFKAYKQLGYKLL